jgi:hypothetical protein
VADLNELNHRTLEELRAHGGKVGGPFAGVPVPQFNEYAQRTTWLIPAIALLPSSRARSG